MQLIVPIDAVAKNKNIFVYWNDLSRLQVVNFILERTQDDGVSWLQLTSTPYLKGTWTDENLDVSQEYRYRIKAYYTDNTESAWSHSPYVRPLDKRKGFSFNNPDITNDHHAQGWGLLITPDELRYDICFGNPLIATNGETYTDEMLQRYIDLSIAYFEHSFTYDLIKKQLRHRPMRDANTGIIIERTDIPVGEVYEYEEAYDFDIKQAAHFLYLKLNRKPILDVTKAEMRDPAGRLIANLLTWCKPNYSAGSVEFVPYYGALLNAPFAAQPGNLQYRPFAMLDSYPDSFFIDYKCGYNNVMDIPPQVRNSAIYWIIRVAAIALLSQYGDGRLGPIASSSISLGGVSESYTTTMSATSAMFGARIIAIRKDLEEWEKIEGINFRGLNLAYLGH